MDKTNKATIKIQALDHVVLRCTNLPAMLDFYVNVLGCHVERQLDELGLYQLRAGTCLIDLVVVGTQLGGENPPEPTSANLDHFCLRIETLDLEILRESLAALDVASSEPARRYGASGFGQSIYISDPQDNQIELKIENTGS